MSETTCPLCGCAQPDGLMCHADTSALERDLGDVPAIVAELDITLSRQARIGSGGKSGVMPNHRDGYHHGASLAADALTNVLTTWARDIAPDWRYARGLAQQSAAYCLLSHIDLIRRHPAVTELVDEITDAIRQARNAVDRPADRIFVGPCLAEFEGVTCTEDLYARPTASHVACKVCGITHDVGERRAWLLDQARDRLFTVREAAQMMGDIGRIKVTEASIRGYIHRGRIAYHTGTLIRLGDLLNVVVNESEKKGAVA